MGPAPDPAPDPAACGAAAEVPLATHQPSSLFVLSALGNTSHFCLVPTEPNPSSITLQGWVGSMIINVVALSYLSSQASESGGSMMTTATITPVWLLIFALLFSSLVGLISGLFPALRAATMVPVTALKYE
ncbi:MAG: ABC transporter permease [Anaerolineales bacterium]|nr:ABC transporter permease [Anaerolineales bacterium]